LDVPLYGLRILVVDDEILIALAAQEMLTDAGAKEIVVATRASEASAYLSGSHPFDAAVIDLDLGQGVDYSLVSIALERRIPFLIASGYGDTIVLPAAFSNILVLSKPYSSPMLVSAVQQAISW
jgi:CheY-like chemotaxis protein